MTAFTSIVGVTLRQLTGRKRMIGFGILSLMPALLLYFAAKARVLDGVDSDLGGLIVSPFFTIVLPLIALVLAGSALGDERKDKTLSFLVLRPIRRIEIAAAKTVAASAVSSALGIFGAAALTVAYVASGGDFGVLPALVVGATITCVVYSAVFVLLGFAVSRPTLTGLIYLLIFENSIVTALPSLAASSPWRIGLAATIDLLPEGLPALEIVGAIGDLPPSLPDAGLRTVAMVILAVGVCTVLLRRTDSV